MNKRVNDSSTAGSGQTRSILRARSIILSILVIGLTANESAQSQAGAQTLPAPTPVVKDGITCKTAMVPMRDGIRLYTEIYLPAGSETDHPVKRPVVTVRSPYGATHVPEGCFGTPWTQGGLDVVTIVQSARGTGSSEGVFAPIRQERDDGIDLINWAVRQPWSNGNVGTTSASYMGLTQWQVAFESPPSLKVITPSVMGANPYDDLILRNGVFDMQLMPGWAQDFVAPNLKRKMTAAGASPEQIDAALKAYQARSAANKMWIDALPMAGTWDAEARELIPFVWEWYQHPTYDDYWKKVDVLAQMDKVRIPVLVGGAWYDIFTKGTLDSYIAVSTKGGSEATRRHSMLVMDCCGHVPTMKLPVAPGQIDWGPNKIDFATLQNRFLERHLTGKDNGIDAEPRVQVAVLVPPDNGTQGDTFIYKTSAWPVPDTRYIDFFLSSGGNANTLNGDGVLSDAARSDGAADSFSYDPKDPVPTIGGGETGGVFDHTPVEKRKDVLVYTAAPASKEMLMIGRISITFWAKTDGKDTDFTAKLVDVHPDGFAHDIADRIVRGRYRKGSQLPPELLTPNEPYQYTLDLGYAATLLKPGHRLRLEISSSNFPRFQRNLNTGASNEDTAETRVARNTILHDAAHPSFITIPVVNRQSSP